MKQLYFVRHGNTQWNAIARMQGQWNSSLNQLGREQAAVNGQLLETLGIQALFASPLERTRCTAEIINRYLNLPIQFDARIKEWHTGDWSGHMYADVRHEWPAEWRALEADRFNYRGPQAENYPDMIARAAPFLYELRQNTAENIAIVSHGMIGRVMVAVLLGMNEQQMLNFHQPNDVVFRVTLLEENAVADHFAGGVGPFEGVMPG